MSALRVSACSRTSTATSLSSRWLMESILGLWRARFRFPVVLEPVAGGYYVPNLRGQSSDAFCQRIDLQRTPKRSANGITIRNNGAHSTYHSLQSRYAGRFMKNALSINASYTFSKTIDNASEIFAFADIGSPNPQNPFNSGPGEKSLSNLNRPHAFSASFIYDLPFFKEQRGFVGHLLGGWQLNGVQVLTSGNPYTPTDTTNGSYGLGNTYLTSGDRAFIGNPNAPANTVAISAVDAWVALRGRPAGSSDFDRVL